MDDATPWQEMARMAQAEARHIAEELDIGGHWRRAGAVVNAVGSFRTNLLVRHRDIDFHVYTPVLDHDLSFRVMAALARSPHLNSLHFVDGSRTKERCLEWHGIWQRPGGAPWQIDIIHMESGSTFDGFSNALPTVFAGAWTTERGTPSSASNMRRRKTRASTGWNITGLSWKGACARWKGCAAGVPRILWRGWTSGCPEASRPPGARPQGGALPAPEQAPPFMLLSLLQCLDEFLALRALQERRQRIHHLLVIFEGALPQNGQGRRFIMTAPVGARTHQGTEGIGHGQDAGRQTDGPALQLTGVAGAVHALVHLLDGLQDRQAEIYTRKASTAYSTCFSIWRRSSGVRGPALVSSSCGRRIMPTWDRLAAVRSVDSSAGSSLPSQAARW